MGYCQLFIKDWFWRILIPCFSPERRHVPCRWREPPEPESTSQQANRPEADTSLPRPAGLCRRSGLDVPHSFRWLTPPAVDVSASGLSPHGIKRVAPLAFRASGVALAIGNRPNGFCSQTTLAVAWTFLSGFRWLRHTGRLRHPVPPNRKCRNP